MRGRRDGARLVLHGRIPWASHLYDDALALLAVQIEGQAR